MNLIIYIKLKLKFHRGTSMGHGDHTLPKMILERSDKEEDELLLNDILNGFFNDVWR